MNRRLRVVTAVLFGAVLAVAGLMGASRLLADTLASDSVPEYVNYQGYLTDPGGDPISGTVTLQFSIWDASSGGNQVWSEAHNNVPVNDGYFSVLLGSQTTPVTADVFGGTARYLEVTYGATTFPRQRFGSVPYALVAEQASEAITSTYATTATYALNAPSSGGGVDWQYVKVVAKSGGDYTTVTDAMNAITPSSTDRYLVLVMPGVYEEQVTLKPYVHLKGAGTATTFISSAANTANPNDEEAATMIVPANTQVSDLTVRNTAATNASVGMEVSGGNANTLLNNVRVEVTTAGGTNRRGINVDGGNGTPKFTHLYVTVSGATAQNWGVFVSASVPTFQDSTIVAEGGTDADGLRFNGGESTITGSTIIGISGTGGVGLSTSGASSDNTITIDRSTIKGGTGVGGASVELSNDFLVFAGASMLQGPFSIGGTSDLTCAQSYDENYVDLVCP